MKPDETPPPAGPPNQETPPASLTAVRVGRRRSVAEVTGKPGDLTQKLGADLARTAAAAPPPAPPSPAALPSDAEVPRAVTSPPTTELPRAMAPPAGQPHPPARLLGEDEIRQLLDPPERRAAPPAPEAVPDLPPLVGRRDEPPPAAPAEPLMVEPDERDGIPPAPTAPGLRLVTEAPTAEPKAPAAAERQPAAAPLSSIDQIIDYWDGLRGSTPFPPLDKLDRGHVGRTWRNCMLVAYGASDSVTPRITRIGEENGEIEYLEMVIDWILSRGRVAARKGEPMEEEKRFPVTGGNARYQLLLLPLATPEGKSEHVLCHLARVKETAKPKGGAFKRWLAS